ncbi:unnamed protein product, partial [Symbiodinium sp. KB8]
MKNENQPEHTGQQTYLHVLHYLSLARNRNKLNHQNQLQITEDKYLHCLDLQLGLAGQHVPVEERVQLGRRVH